MRTRTFIGFVAPSVLSMLLLIAVPLVGVVYLALYQSHVKTEMVEVHTKVPLFGGLSKEQVGYVPQAVLDEAGRAVRVWDFVGLQNLAKASEIHELGETLTKPRGAASLPDMIDSMYRDITNLDFWSALEFTLIYVAATTPLMLAIGFLLALAVNRAAEGLKGSLIFVSLLPMIVTPVVSSLAVYWLFLDNAVVATVLRELGLGQIYFLKDAVTIRILIIAYGVWYAAPFAFIILYAGLQTVPKESLEAARVDGATRWQAIRLVTIPHLMPLFAVVVLIHLMDAYRVFEPILVFNSRVFASSLQYLVYIVLSFEDNVHKAAAYAVLTVIGIVILLIPVLVGTWRGAEDSAVSVTDRLPLWLKGLNTAGLAIWLFVAMFPFLWMFLISFRLPVDAFSAPPKLLAPLTLRNFYGVWIIDGFWRYAVNTAVVTVFSVVISLTVACPAAYALSRYRGSLGFWLLVAALIFRAMPHVVLLTAYRPAFFSLGIWSRYETLIIVLTAINQPFTIWMMRSFFMNIPKELDEAALIDGCSRFQAFRLAIMPVMWPGVVTAALFAFLLSYNDFLISSQLMNGDMATMTAALGNYMGQAKHLDKLMLGIAGAVSVTIPVIVLIYLFQKQIVAGMTAGAVKG